MRESSIKYWEIQHLLHTFLHSNVGKKKYVYYFPFKYLFTLTYRCMYMHICKICTVEKYYSFPKILVFFLLSISRESIVFRSNLRNGDFDGFIRFEVKTKVTFFAVCMCLCV